MNVIAVDSYLTAPAVRDVLLDVRQSPPRGWQPIEFNSTAELIAKLKDLNAGSINELEIVSEGSPTHLDHVSLQRYSGWMSANDFGKALKKVPGFSSSSVVFLSGCNTGCSMPFGLPASKCSAQKLARALGGPVRGALGYLVGLHARNNEKCLPYFIDSAGNNHPPFPGAVSAPVYRSLCWREFVP